MAESPPAFHTVLLVGFMGSGKSTVGRLAARLLGWELVDVDDVVQGRSGRTIEEIFREEGEAAFRALEEEVTAEALSRPRRVVVPGGGWAAAPGRMEMLGNRVLTVWLRVTAEEAVRRSSGGETVRPLLEVPDPVARARELLEAREHRYARAHLHLDTAGASPERLAGAVVEHVRSGGDPAPR